MTTTSVILYVPNNSSAYTALAAFTGTGRLNTPQAITADSQSDLSVFYSALSGPGVKVSSLRMSDEIRDKPKEVAAFLIEGLPANNDFMLMSLVRARDPHDPTGQTFFIHDFKYARSDETLECCLRLAELVHQ